MKLDRIIFAIGILSPWLALGYYSWRVSQHDLSTPSYLGWLAFGPPILALASMARRFSMWKFFGFGAALIPIAVCIMLLFGMNLPEYDGPVKVGETLPKFSSLDADGKPFGLAQLATNETTLLVLFRGSW
ncbi:MAG: hypothetical protein V3W41_04305 [Planctomycetota bacterium]